MASRFVVLLVLSSVFFEAVGAQKIESNMINISLGSSLFPTIQQTSWHSHSRRFAFGFYPQGTGFMVGIWLVGKSENTTVWTANRDDPPVSSNATLELTTNGKLLLRTEQSQQKIIADSLGSASFASMLDSGNFVLFNKDFGVVWQSFDFPTDTLLGRQTLFPPNELFSSLDKANYSTGRFRLKMQNDGNLVLYPVNTLDSSVDAYWTSDSCCRSQTCLYLNDTGELAFINTTTLANVETFVTLSNSYNDTIIYRATLDYDGSFHLYSHSFDSNGEYKTLIKWSALKKLCEVKSFCGLNSYCTFIDNQPDCLCLPGNIFTDPTDKSRGCERNFTKEWCKVGGEDAAFYYISPMENMMWDDPPYFKASMQNEDCRKSCLEDCNCEVALFQNDYCMKQKLPLKYARRDLEQKSTAFFKVGMKSVKTRNDTTSIPAKPQVIVTTTKESLVLMLVVTLGFITCSCVALGISGIFIFKFRVEKYRRLLEHGNLGLTEELTLRSFSYNELRKATNGFKEELGKGSFGAVYRGTLYKGKKLVAVKRLEKVAVNEGEREFQAEMRVIGRTHHRNLVRLLGYCAEASKRLLVYEYMSNGSLADLLFHAERRPDWTERVRIALDVARGILYLHEECEAPTIHCDIKASKHSDG